MAEMHQQMYGTMTGLLRVCGIYDLSLLFRKQGHATFRFHYADRALIPKRAENATIHLLHQALHPQAVEYALPKVKSTGAALVRTAIMSSFSGNGASILDGQKYKDGLGDLHHIGVMQLLLAMGGYHYNNLRLRLDWTFRGRLQRTEFMETLLRRGVRKSDLAYHSLAMAVPSIWRTIEPIGARFVEDIEAPAYVPTFDQNDWMISPNFARPMDVMQVDEGQWFRDLPNSNQWDAYRDVRRHSAGYYIDPQGYGYVLDQHEANLRNVESRRAFNHASRRRLAKRRAGATDQLTDVAVFAWHLPMGYSWLEPDFTAAAKDWDTPIFNPRGYFVPTSWEGANRQRLDVTRSQASTTGRTALAGIMDHLLSREALSRVADNVKARARYIIQEATFFGHFLMTALAPAEPEITSGDTAEKVEQEFAGHQPTDFKDMIAGMGLTAVEAFVGEGIKGLNTEVLGILGPAVALTKKRRQESQDARTGDDKDEVGSGATALPPPSDPPVKA
jgi:hypothetical protein